MTVILSKVLAYLDGLRLSLSQWLLVLCAAIIGGLAIKLRLQGQALHRARVALLSQSINMAQTSEDENLLFLKDTLNRAIVEYKGTK